MKAAEDLLKMIDSDLAIIDGMVSPDGNVSYLEETLLVILNNQHTILLVLKALLKGESEPK